jgi:ribosomal protein S18 acetylase RimI-like enzyme
LVIVRLAEPAEYARVGALTIAAYRSLPVDHLWGGYDDEILDTEERAKHAEVLVAVDGIEVVGSVTYVSDPASKWREWTEPGEVQFRLLAVDPGARSRGAGVALVRACLARAEAAQRTIVIHTTPWMDVARAMYERLGFMRRPDRDVPDDVWNDPPVENLPPEWVGQAFWGYSWTPAA